MEHCKQYRTEEEQRQTIRQEMFFKKFKLNVLPPTIFHMEMHTVNEYVFVSLPSTIQATFWSLQALFNIATVMAVPAQHH